MTLEPRKADDAPEDAPIRVERDPALVTYALTLTGDPRRAAELAAEAHRAVRERRARGLRAVPPPGSREEARALRAAVRERAVHGYGARGGAIVVGPLRFGRLSLR